ncbi:MAG: transcription antitermination factor NusB [Desulfotomaculaceae bacterium]|nr:transcription antitermination factor NusB [Desulfotomaculaceae bacterium]
MSRRQARERALQVLYQTDVGGADLAGAFRYMDEEFGAIRDEDKFVQRLVCGTIENMAPIDKVIAVVSKEWHINRMARVDRNIMRLALYEILYCMDIPNNVSVNEAVELGKIYGGEDSGRFINGILGKVIENPGAYLQEQDNTFRVVDTT